MPKVSCIIPAYNEGPRIENVLRAIHKHPMIGEVVVVDDCSNDNTSDIVRKFDGIRLIVHEKNSGKSKAVVTGISASTGEIIVLLDSDLVGLNSDNISELVRPVVLDKADVSFSVRKVFPLADLFYRFVGMDILTGERAFKKSLVAGRLEEIGRLSRFGIETFFNNVIIESKSRIKVVFWDNVRSPMKSKKQGFISGMLADIYMFVDILKTASVFGILRQFVKLRKLRV